MIGTVDHLRGDTDRSGTPVNAENADPGQPRDCCRERAALTTPDVTKHMRGLEVELVD
jgi:hypothetical protein